MALNKEIREPDEQTPILIQRGAANSADQAGRLI
jgi:hypothetical protein